MNLAVPQITNTSAFICYLIVGIGALLTLLVINAYEARSDGKHQIPPRKKSKFYLFFYTLGCKYIMKQIAKQIAADSDSDPILH